MKLNLAAPTLLLFAAVVSGQEAIHKDEDPAPKEPALRAELLAMEKESADIHNSVTKELSEKGIAPGERKTIRDPALVKVLLEPTRRLNEADQKHRTRLKEIMKKYGWPGQTLVGKDGARAAWLLALRAERDVAFQKQCLKLMKSARRGEVEPQDIAYLTDSVLVGEKKKQLYGTQLMVKGGRYKARPLEDEANVDKRRAEMGMAPLAEYLEMAQAEFDKASGNKKEKK